MEEEKKVERKRKRFAARLKSSKSVICSDTPGPNIVLCNVGQASGLEKDAIYKLAMECSHNLTLPKLITEKGESHSFLVFSNAEDALVFYNAYNGKTKIDGVLIYMSFVENVPNTEIICPHENPNGLLLLNDFITIEEENEFITLFDWSEESNLKNRQVKHYGYEFRYGSNDVDLSAPLTESIPKECDVLWRRLRENGVIFEEPDQLTVNKYNPGQGIPSHVDKHSPFGDTILSLSLGSTVVMEWKHHSGKHVPVVVPARSMLVMQGEARYDWQHGIQPRTHDPVIVSRAALDHHHRVITDDFVSRGTRISLTFRRTRVGPCECNYRTMCDSAGERELGDDVAEGLEELHVHQVYERIAGHFSATRHTPWPRVVQFMRLVPTGSVVLDLGCGNGKNMLLRSDLLQVGCERSSGLLSECASRVRGAQPADCVRMDVLRSALQDRCADAVICVAVVHHFSTKARRIQAISTISRLLRTDGRALITVWAKDQKKSNYLCKNKTPTNQEVLTANGIPLPVHENRTEFQHNDLLVPWKLRSRKDAKVSEEPENTLLRYYHVFEDNELSDLCKQIPELIVESSFYEEGNLCVICRKI